MTIHDVSKLHGGKKCITTCEQVISMNFDKALIHVPIQETIQWDIENLSHIIITLYHPWDTPPINYRL